MCASSGTPPSNPFSTKFIRPGAVPFLFEGAESAEKLVQRLSAQQWRGQIVGPHGSGKSTLLETLEIPLRLAGRRVWHGSLHDGQRRLPHGWVQAARQQQANQIVIDGYEQLGRGQRWQLRVTCRLRRWGLLVTAHADVGLPTLYQTKSDLRIAEHVVQQLLAGQPTRLEREQVAIAYQEAGGDVRETLFRLYDMWEIVSRERRSNDAG